MKTVGLHRHVHTNNLSLADEISDSAMYILVHKYTLSLT